MHIEQVAHGWECWVDDSYLGTFFTEADARMVGERFIKNNLGPADAR